MNASGPSKECVLLDRSFPPHPAMWPPPNSVEQTPDKNSSADDASDPSTTHRASQIPEAEFPSGFSLWFIFLGLFLAVLCLGLDRTIVATAVPKITAEFNSLSDIGWYGSAYMLTSCCFQLMFGKLYAEFNIKWMFLIALAIFETGSIVCAAAPNSTALILGRAIAGLGGAGLMTGALVILAHSVPLHARPRVTGAIGGAIGIAQIVAPTLGGAFTDYATWRWCFWINLPMGAVTFAAVLFLVRLPASATNTAEKKTLRQLLAKFDLLGTVFLLPAIVCLLLALQWGGTEYAWGDWRNILTLTIFGVATLVWGFIQYRAGPNATVPMHIIKNRSVVSGMWFMFTIMGVFLTLIQFVPVWFQAVKGISAYQSGIDLLAMAVPVSVMVIVSGFAISKVGYYVPAMIAATILTSVACGMLTLFDLDTTSGYWIATLVLLGAGIGIGAQTPIIIPQVILTGPDLSLGTSVVIFAQTLSGTVWVSVANNMFNDGLVRELIARAPEVDPHVVVAAGATGISEKMGRLYPDSVDEILAAYGAALRKVWIIPVVLACLSALGVVFVEWRSIKKPKPEEKKDESGEKGMEEENMTDGASRSGTELEGEKVLKA
ncbi:major facilitator superfamily domain-containing protein [Lasiosphaeria hispida]|uniref:Major facilitator superfamily domain-containing protein n=1 Tax=Lasiosphaeria hispida TaxID=260671 RepID=A0AAJ0HJ56_9PEZI|nr:major facilitator superfamily domain-containing protein [Lasiosphaeria hispida]